MTTIEHSGMVGAAAVGRRSVKTVKMMGFSEFWKMMPDLFLASVSINVLALALPLTLLQVYDRIIPNQAIVTMWLLSGGVVTAMLLEALIKMGRVYITGWIAARFEHKVTCAGLHQLVDANIIDYEQNSPSVHAEHFRSASVLRDFYSGEALLSLFDLPFTVGYLFLFWMIGGVLVIVPVSLFLLYGAIMLFSGRKVGEDIRNRNILDERRYSFITEVMQGIHTVKTMAVEALMQRRYERLQEASVEQSYQSVTHSLSSVDIGSVISQLLVVLVVAFGAGLVLDGRLTPGGVAACVMLGARGLQPLRGAFNLWLRVQGVTEARRQVEKLFEVPVAENARRPTLPAIGGGLSFDNVTLRYPKATSAFFSNITLSIKPGECIAISGDSGSGKTSLLSLMAGMIAPTGGRVLVDEYNLADFAPASFPRQIALLPQQGELFQGTLLENLTMFDSSLDTMAMEIARELGLDRVVAGMRNGYDTWVGGSVGETIPAGVKQRIAIARVLVLQPKIILFDEANIGIDSGGDELLRQYLQKLKGHRTMVLVTHRPSLLKLADSRYQLTDRTLVPQVRGQTGFLVANDAGTKIGRIADRPEPKAGVAHNLSNSFSVATDLSMCLVGLLTAMEWRGNPRQLVESLPHMTDAMDLTGFRRVMSNLNYIGRTSRASLSVVDPLSFPCLFIPDRGAAKVLLKEEAGFILAFDGVTLATIQLKRDRTCGAITVFEERKRSASSAVATPKSWVGAVIARFAPLLWMNLGLTIAITMLGLAGPIFVMTVYNRAIPADDIEVVPYLVVGVGIAAIVE
ncbi:MAG: ATP-binding cassette domain-containing protein [Rhodospirillaceae bacterium]